MFVVYWPALIKSAKLLKFYRLYFWNFSFLIFFFLDIPLTSSIIWVSGMCWIFYWKPWPPWYGWNIVERVVKTQSNKKIIFPSYKPSTLKVQLEAAKQTYFTCKGWPYSIVGVDISRYFFTYLVHRYKILHIFFFQYDKYFDSFTSRLMILAVVDTKK